MMVFTKMNRNRRANSVDQPVLLASMVTNVKRAPADSNLETHSVSSVMKKKLLKAIHASPAVQDALSVLALTLAQNVKPLHSSPQTTNVAAAMVTSSTLRKTRASSVVTPVRPVKTVISVKRALLGLFSVTLSVEHVQPMNSSKATPAPTVGLIV